MTRASRYLQVTAHAVVRARQRYGLANVDWLLIHDDVYRAFLAGRVSKDHPSGSGKQAEDGCVFAWTENLLRVYVVTVFRNAQGRACLSVKTALPGVYRHHERRAA